MRVGVSLLVAVTAFLFSCRDIQPVQPSSATSGFQLKGVVTTPDGLPLSGVEIRLYYNYDFVRDTPIDTQQVIVRDSSKIVDVAVYTPTYQLVQELFLGYRSTGPVPRYSWNGLDYTGALVPSGKYLLRYVVDTVVVKYSILIVEGHPTALTDTNGRFTITSDRLPVDEVFDHYLSNNTYEGTYIVLPSIDIILRKSPLSKTYTDIALERNRVVSVAFTLE